MRATEVTKIERTKQRGRNGSIDWRAFDKAPRVYVSPKGEGIIENLMNRCSRPSAAYRKAVQDVALKELGLDSENFALTWSQYAGCSCPCSPGFIVRKKNKSETAKFACTSMPRADVWVTVEAETPDEVSAERKDMSAEDMLIARMELAGALKG